MACIYMLRYQKCTTISAKIYQIIERYGIINIIHRLFILTYYYHLKWVYITQRVHSLWVCFTPEGVIQNGSIFKSWTHTSGHFNIGVAPPGCVYTVATEWTYVCSVCTVWSYVCSDCGKSFASSPHPLGHS